jgi:hypothetical protein
MLPMDDGTDPNTQVQPQSGYQAPQQAAQSGGGYQIPQGVSPTDRTAVGQYVDYLGTLPGADPKIKSGEARDYYINQIIANGGGLTPDNVAYWQSHVTNPANYGGNGGGDQGGAGYGGQGGFSFDPSQVANDPGYQFALGQGLNAIQSSAAAKGTLLGSGTMKDLANYGAGAAYQGENQLFNQHLAGFQTNFNNLGSLVNTGSNAAQQQGNYGTQAANAQAAGTVGGANAFTGALGGVSNAAQNYALYKQFGPQTQSHQDYLNKVKGSATQLDANGNPINNGTIPFNADPYTTVTPYGGGNP